MVDRGGSSRASSKLLSITKSRKSSSASSEFDEEYRVRLEGKYLGNGLVIRPPSGTNHQQPGSHLSIDTRLSELSLATSDHLTDDGTLHSSNHTSASSKKSSPYRVLVEKPNCYIRSPFKQGYQVPNKGTTQVVDPSIQLKKVTQDSIDRVRQQFRRPRPPPRSFVNAPRLRKAKLKTTGRPISGSGPSIKQCRGIQGGARVTSRPTPPRFYDYEDPLHPRSPSLRPASPTELHRPESSIHCTSRVPSEYGDISLSDQTIETCSHVIDSGSRCADKPDVVNGSFEHSDLIDLSSSIDLERSLDPITDHLLNSDYLVNNETDLYDADRNKFQTTEHHLSDDSLENHDIIERKENGTSNDHELSCDGDSEEKSNSNKSTSIKRNGNCKPFSDNIDNNDDDNDDDDDESQSRLHNRTLLSSYNNRSTLKASNQNGDKSNSGKNDTHNGNKMGNENKMGNKARNDNANSIEREENSLTCQTKLFTILPLKNKVKNYKSKKGESVLVPDGCAHIVKTTNSEDFPVMTVHVRGKVEKNEHQNTRTEDDIHEHIDSNKSDYKDRPDYDGDMNDDDDDDDLDTDRIPSAIIWKNIDQLNLSMNASSHPLNDVTKFSSKARKVQSAGPRGRPTTELSNGGSSKLPKTKPRSRASSGKTKRTKVKPEEIDKAEILRRYLSEESKKFSENLPGYFTEQFNIIQESKRGKNGDDEEEEEFISKALVKYEEQDHKDNQNKECNGSAEEKKSSLYSIEVEDPTSSGVFFTIESTTNSTFDVDSLSEQTVGESSDTREFSDDTGFETMPGSGLSGRKNTGTKMDSSTTMDAGMGSILDDDLKHDIKDEYLRFSVNHEDLEVIAKAKHLTDPRSRNLHYKSCPYEPLNFTINARPLPGYLFYFAYGVDMNAKRMSLYLRRDYKRLWGVLFGFKLRFNKRGSSSDAGGFANVEFSAGNSVEGCVYTITDADLSMLDNCMGYPKHYCRVVLPVWMSNCHEPGLHGVAQYCVPAVLYVAQQQWLEPGKTDYLDCSYSISQCLKASDILTPNYVEYLNQLAAV